MTAGLMKGKRGVIKRIQARVGNEFNVSVTECDAQDLWQRAVMGFAAGGTSETVVQATLRRIVDFIESLGLAQLGAAEVECFHC